MPAKAQPLDWEDMKLYPAVLEKKSLCLLIILPMVDSETDFRSFSLFFQHL
jgi:hypothetical protein